MLNKKIIFLSFLVSVFLTNVFFAMDKIVKMPGKDVLKERLNKLDTDFFEEKSDYIAQLADTKKSPRDIVSIALSLKYEYTSYTLKGVTGGLPGLLAFRHKDAMSRFESYVMYALLQDEPDVLKVLQERDSYKPRK